MKMIAVFHHKGGVGKSTLLFNKACAHAEQGHKILMMDLLQTLIIRHAQVLRLILRLTVTVFRFSAMLTVTTQLQL